MSQDDDVTGGDDFDFIDFESILVHLVHSFLRLGADAPIRLIGDNGYVVETTAAVARSEVLIVEALRNWTRAGAQRDRDAFYAVLLPKWGATLIEESREFVDRAIEYLAPRVRFQAIAAADFAGSLVLRESNPRHRVIYMMTGFAYEQAGAWPMLFPDVFTPDGLSPEMVGAALGVTAHTVENTFSLMRDRVGTARGDAYNAFVADPDLVADALGLDEGDAGLVGARLPRPRLPHLGGGAVLRPVPPPTAN